MSKEHFWPQWLRPLIKPSAPDGHISEIHEGVGKGGLSLKLRTEKQGSVITKKFRVVCATCNNGWMSKLEENAKTIIADLMNGKRPSLNIEQLNILSTWTATKVMVAEHGGDRSPLTPFEDRHNLYLNGVIPAYFRIYLGLHSSKTETAYHRHSTTVSRTLKGPCPPLPTGITRNIQTTSFLIGPLLMHTISARVDDFDIDEIFHSSILLKIFPSHHSPVNTAQMAVIDDNGLSILANWLNKLLSSSNVLWINNPPFTNT